MIMFMSMMALFAILFAGYLAWKIYSDVRIKIIATNARQNIAAKRIRKSSGVKPTNFKFEICIFDP